MLAKGEISDGFIVSSLCLSPIYPRSIVCYYRFMVVRYLVMIEANPRQ